MSRLAAIAYAAILAGCSLSGPSTEQKVASKALLDASERCVHDVRDKNIKYERSPNCTSLKALSLQYIKTGGARAESALETEIDFERARVHAWMARALSADPAATHICVGGSRQVLIFQRGDAKMSTVFVGVAMVLLLLAAGSALVQSPDDQKHAAQAELYRRHPDAQGVLADPAFGQWVAASPERVEMLRRAHEHFDVAAADALFTAWKRSH